MMGARQQNPELFWKAIFILAPIEGAKFEKNESKAFSIHTAHIYAVKLQDDHGMKTAVVSCTLS
jgi:hypothetical protein